MIKGTTSAPFIKKSIGSVPAKYETVVYMNQESKKKGFGSNSERFTDALSRLSTDKEPGPGSYLQEYDTNFMLKKSESFSRKGYGNGFISKHDRFKDNSLWYSKYQPGPGSYEASTH